MTDTRIRKFRIAALALAALLCAGVLSGCRKEGSGSGSADTAIAYSDEDLDAAWDAADCTTITLGGGKAGVDGQGATLSGNTVLIFDKGTYVLEGALGDGQVIVTAKDQADVRLVLNNASISCSTGAPIYVKSADKVVITLAEGTSNTVTDLRAEVSEGEGAQDAAVFSADDLTINGAGALTITSNAAAGIECNDSLKLVSGTLNVTASVDGLRGNDCVAVKGATITVSAGDDGIHSDTRIGISGGAVTIAESYEGIESAAISVSGGTVRVKASDDGLNTSGGVDGSALSAPMGRDQFNASDGSSLDVTGGYIYVDAAGDGVDVNGDITMSGGTVIVCGPTESMNGALDFASFEMSGGIVAAAGSAGMAMAPEGSQNSMLVSFGSVQAAGTVVHVEAGDGTDILTFAPAKEFETLALSSPLLKTGDAVTVSTGGSATGTAVDGVYSGGAYTGGSDAVTLTVSSGLTGNGVTGNRNSGMPGRRR